MEQLIKRLSESINFAEEHGKDMDSANWGAQEGMLISYNEAKMILDALKTAFDKGHAEGQHYAHSCFQDEVSYRGWK